MSVKDEIQKLRLDARFGKDNHLIAADRMRTYQYWLGQPLIAISIILGTAIFIDLAKFLSGQIAGGIFGLISAFLPSLQTFLNPKEMEKGHRSIGNRYLEI